MLSLEIQNGGGEVLASAQRADNVSLVYKKAYQPGDAIVLRSAEEGVYLLIQLEDSMGSAFVYMAGKEYRFTIPFDEKRTSYSPKSFTGELHALTARTASDEEISAYRNVALNPYDQHENTACFPHASANVETRGEAVFAARNAINGNTVSDSHGEWPYESWGINRRSDAAITVHFGRPVVIDKAVLTLRADFPHDNYWEKVTLFFSDGTSHTASLAKTGDPQSILLESKTVTSVTLGELIQSQDPSPFPALTQLEFYGREG